MTQFLKEFLYNMLTKSIQIKGHSPYKYIIKRFFYDPKFFKCTSNTPLAQWLTSVEAALEMHSLDALPVVVPHLHPLTKLHAKPNSKAIANSNVQNEGIPPALLEIWQQVREKYLQGVETIATERQDTHLGGKSVF